ncbi:MAG TPA: hypothetical protein VIF62_04360 [Labilithrix sp.]|jgi:hypothetical protein
MTLSRSRALGARPLLLVVAGVAIAVAAACTTDYQKGLDDPNYGGPNALVGEKQPPTSSELTGGGGEGGASSSGGGAACGMAVDGGPCAVSWSKDLVPAFQMGTSCSIVGCHGQGAAPQFDLTNASGAYTALANWKIADGRYYIDPCSTDPTKGALECNVAKAAPQCGAQHMPTGGQLPDDVLTKIDTWSKCGSPNN